MGETKLFANIATIGGRLYCMQHAACDDEHDFAHNRCAIIRSSVRRRVDAKQNSDSMQLILPIHQDRVFVPMIRVLGDVLNAQCALPFILSICNFGSLCRVGLNSWLHDKVH